MLLNDVYMHNKTEGIIIIILGVECKKNDDIKASKTMIESSK